MIALLASSPKNTVTLTRQRVVEVADPCKSAYMRNLLFCYDLFNDPEYTVDDRLMGYVYHERVASEKTQSL